MWREGIRGARAVPQWAFRLPRGPGLGMARRGCAYFVAGVFADVGDIPIDPHRHLLANQIRLFGMTNHPRPATRAACVF